MKISEINNNEFTVVSIEELHITKRFNEHTICEMTVIIEQENISKAYQKLKDKITLVDDNGRIVFFGYILNLDIKYGHNGLLKIRAVSSSVKTDITPKNRIFRNTENSLKKIIEKIQASDNNFNVHMEEDVIIEHPVIQKNETNFQFIKRLASEYGFYIIVTDNSDKDNGKADFTVSKKQREGNVQIQLDDAVSVHCIWDFYKCFDKVINGLVVISDLMVDTGNTVSVNGNGDESFHGDYIAYEVDIYKKYNSFLCEYKLYEPSNFPEAELIVIPDTVHIDAVVTDNDDKEGKGRIKVDFVDEKFEDMDKDKDYWIPYHSPYSAVKEEETTGFVFLPDKNEPVDVVFCNNEMFADACLRRKKKGKYTSDLKIDSDLENPSKNKYIANIHEKQVTFTKDKLELKAKENTVTLTDEDIVIKVKNNTITLSGDKIEIKSGNNMIVINSSDIEIKSSGKVDVNSKSHVNISGKKIDIS